MTFLSAQQIVLASGNLGKIKEIQALLAGHQIVAQSAFNVAEADETACTFVENALIKARNATLHCNLPAIADDSGLVVDALKGYPGVISARYAGVGATDQENIKKLLLALDSVPEAQRTARFICVMVFMAHANDPCPAGSNGFGYDPVFWVPDHQCASAELSADDKNAISHRGQAIRSLTHLLTLSAQ